MSTDWVTDIVDMHIQFEMGPSKVFLDGDLLRFRQNFLEEELREFDEAIQENNPEKAVDALIDLCVIAIGTLDLGKIDTHEAWNRVLIANRKKIRGINDSRPNSRGVDLVKPEGWVPPSHNGNTGNFGPAIQGIHARRIGFKTEVEIPSHIETLQQYRDFAISKTHDYDDIHDPEFFHATYYPSGINDILYEISKKVKRIRRGLKRWFESGDKPKTDSLQDSFRDISIYSAIGGTYINGNLEGQTEDRDIFNREITPSGVDPTN